MIPLVDNLRFVFRGYSIWLELNQNQGDLNSAIDLASQEIGSYPIPCPHATVIYGMEHLPEAQVCQQFRTLESKISEWPDLKYSGYLSAIETTEMKHGEMDMAWIELSYSWSADHQALIDLVAQAMLLDNSKSSGCWSPHISLAYDNPERPIAEKVVQQLVSDMPSLCKDRKVTGIGLWKTCGTIDEWTMIDRFDLDPSFAYKSSLISSGESSETLPDLLASEHDE